jgi:hypothetical protein
VHLCRLIGNNNKLKERLSSVFKKTLLRYVKKGEFGALLQKTIANVK